MYFFSSSLNQDEKTKECVKNEPLSQENKSLAPEDFESESVYSIVDQCSLPLKKKKNKAKSHSSSSSKNRSGDSNLLVSEQMDFRQFDGAQTSIANESITPYACFYGPSVKKLKAGWLDKLSPQGYGICGDYCVIAKMYVCMKGSLVTVVGRRELLLSQEHRAFLLHSHF